MAAEKIIVDGQEIACLVSDSAQQVPLVFLHGAGSTREVWQAQWLYFRDRAKVVAPDLPGHGDSSGKSPDTIDAYADVVVKLADKLGLGKCVLVGHSMGGAIAQRIALLHPELLAGLVLVATGARLRVMPQVFSTIQTDYGQYVELASSFSMSPSTDVKTRSLFREILAHCAAQAAHNDFTACNRFDIMDTLAAIKTKTMIIAGDRDMMTPLKYAQFLNQKIEASQLVIIGDAGHMVMMEKPDEVNSAIEKFAASIR